MGYYAQLAHPGIGIHPRGLARQFAEAALIGAEDQITPNRCSCAILRFTFVDMFGSIGLG